MQVIVHVHLYLLVTWSSGYSLDCQILQGSPQLLLSSADKNYRVLPSIECAVPLLLVDQDLRKKLHTLDVVALPNYQPLPPPPPHIPFDPTGGSGWEVRSMGEEAENPSKFPTMTYW